MDKYEEILHTLHEQDELKKEEDEKEQRRKGCCLVGCLLLLLLFLLLLFALFLPVKHQKAAVKEETVKSTGAARFKVLSAKSYYAYKGYGATSKGLVTIVNLRLTNIDSVSHVPNTGMVTLQQDGYSEPFRASDVWMDVAVYNQDSSQNPWNKSLKPGESRDMLVAFMINRPGEGNFSLKVKDFDWTNFEYTKLAIGKIPVEPLDKPPLSRDPGKPPAALKDLFPAEIAE